MDSNSGSVMEPQNTNRKILLNNGRTMPIIGLGMFLTKSESEVETAMTAALEAGYRHFDTAFAYKNEEMMGRTLKKVIDGRRLHREDIFITTKLPPNGLDPKDVEYFFNKSLSDLQLDYVDLYLIHFPVATKRNVADDYDHYPMKDGTVDGNPTVDLVETWRVLESFVDKGLAKSIGISNFNSEQIKRIYDNARIKPAVLQVECHAYHAQFQLQEFCRELKIAFTAFSPIAAPGSKGADQPLIGDPQLKPMSEKYGKSPAQIALRYLVQRDVIVIPKSITPKRIQENIQIFDFTLSDEDMNTLKSMNRNKRYFLFNSSKGVPDQPEFPFRIPF